MSKSQGHPFHLVNPSPMPILTAFSMMAFMLGIGLTFHDEPSGRYVMAAGAVAIIICCYYWWKDVVHEGMVDHAHTPIVQRGLRAGMGLFIVSEIMFFFAFFWAFFNASAFPLLPLTDLWAIAAGPWPPVGIKPFDAWDLPFINTLILLLSGTTVTWAHHALLHKDNKNLVRGLTCTVLLGLTFTSLQAFEYSHAAFGLKDTVFASTFYLATGFHGLHVMIGTAFLAVCLVRAHKGQLTPKGHLGFEFAAWYWHFVDVVWLFLFVCVYWWGSGDK